MKCYKNKKQEHSTKYNMKVSQNLDVKGISSLNLAAFYSCALLPETLCEEFNSFLDRAMLTDSVFGFLNATFFNI